MCYPANYGSVEYTFKEAARSAGKRALRGWSGLVQDTDNAVRRNRKCMTELGSKEL